tara:strand:- start:1413 stop:3413 length:2001 start_codon:yes stop_codon:yes gene_type:complete
MNQYNSRLATTQYANQTISQRIEASKSQAEQQKEKAIDGVAEGGRLLGAEFLKNSLQGLGGRLSKVTGLRSVGQLGKNISDKGFAKGLAKTIADSKKEAVKMGTEFGKDKIDELTKKAKGFLNKATPEDNLLKKLVGGTNPEEILSGKKDLLSALSDAKGQATSALSDATSAVSDVKAQASSAVGDAKSALSDAKSAVGDAKAQAAGLQGQATSALDDAKSQASGLQGQGQAALDDAKGQAAGLEGKATNLLGSVEDEAGDALTKGQEVLDRLQAGTGSLPNLVGDAEKSSSGVFGKFKGLFSKAVNTDKLQQIKSDAQKALDIAGKQPAKEVNPFTGETIKSKLFSDPDAAPKFDLVPDGKGGFLQEESERIFDKRSGDLANDLSKGKKTLFDPFDFSSQSNKLDAMKKKALGQVEENKAQLAKQAEDLKAQAGSAVEDGKAAAGDLKSKAVSVAEDLKSKAEDLSTDSGKNISQAFQQEAENKVRGVFDDVAASNEFGDEFGNLSLQTPKTLKVSGTAIPEPEAKAPEPQAKAPEPQAAPEPEPSFQPSQDSGGPAPKAAAAPEPTVQPQSTPPPVSAPEQDSSLVPKAVPEVEKDTDSLVKDVETGAEGALDLGTDGIGGEVFEGLMGIGSIVLPSLLGGDTPSHSQPLTSGLSQTSTMGLGR